MRIPKKKELLELQKKYRTDKKIGDVYGVPARLVAYWRSKKKIGSYSYPKYTEEKIVEYWERFGDDAKAGDELGISAAGFRQWRRKYNIISKPVQLRLEQLELVLGDNNRKKSSKRETVIQKILTRKAGLKKAEIGEIVSIEPDLAISNSQAYEVIKSLKKLNTKKVWDPSKIAIVIDQRLRAESSLSMGKHKFIQEFAKNQKIRNFFDVGEGSSNHVILENGLILPGQLGLGTDQLSSSYGCIGAAGSEISTDEMAALWATGKIWLKIPGSLKVILNGKPDKGVFVRDIISKLLRDFSKLETNYKSIEYFGQGISNMSISERLTLTCLTVASGAKTAIVPFDDLAARFLRKITKTRYTVLKPDPDAIYENEIEVDISYLTPQVSSNGIGIKVEPIELTTGKKIDVVVLGACVNGQIEDLEIAAKILRGRRINREIKVTVIPSSRKTLIEAIDRGYIKTFVESGCEIASPGCQNCIAQHLKILSDREKILTTSCGNFDNGFNDSKGPEILMSSPATAAATALEGVIADPRKYL